MLSSKDLITDIIDIEEKIQAPNLMNSDGLIEDVEESAKQLKWQKAEAKLPIFVIEVVKKNLNNGL